MHRRLDTRWTHAWLSTVVVGALTALPSFGQDSEIVPIHVHDGHYGSHERSRGNSTAGTHYYSSAGGSVVIAEHPEVGLLGELSSHARAGTEVRLFGQRFPAEASVRARARNHKYARSWRLGGWHADLGVPGLWLRYVDPDAGGYVQLDGHLRADGDSVSSGYGMVDGLTSPTMRDEVIDEDLNFASEPQKYVVMVGPVPLTIEWRVGWTAWIHAESSTRIDGTVREQVASTAANTYTPGLGSWGGNAPWSASLRPRGMVSAHVTGSRPLAVGPWWKTAPSPVASDLDGQIRFTAYGTATAGIDLWLIGAGLTTNLSFGSPTTRFELKADPDGARGRAAVDVAVIRFVLKAFAFHRNWRLKKRYHYLTLVDTSIGAQSHEFLDE
ncbi:MAG: hypothetical protein AAGA20_22060 [Planctomycetota bacterium]